MVNAGYRGAMARKKRIWIPGCYYHVGNRGNRREPLFRKTQDFKRFLFILQQTHERFPFEIPSYCLMTNHIHFIIRSYEHSISKIMSIVSKKYADYFNNEYSLTGHVFEKRFYDHGIDSYVGLHKLSHYIHLNPVKANIVGMPEDYQWSSYQYFQKEHEQPPPYFTSHHLLECYTGTLSEKKERFRIDTLNAMLENNEEMEWYTN
jgi:putative transposase